MFFINSYKKIFSILFNKICCKYFPDVNHSIYHFTAYNFEYDTRITVYNNFLNSSINTQEQKETFIKIYNEATSLLRFFQKSYSRIIYKKTKIHSSVLDMKLEPLYLLNKKNKFTFIHNNKIYTFSVSDMIRIINSSLMAHDKFFNCPKFPSNPYNNVKFTETILYNLYYHMVEHYITVPEIFKRFVDCSMTIKTFLRRNENFVREYNINTYDRTLTADELYQEIILFLRLQKIDNLFIHIDYPKKEVIEKFRTIIKYMWHSNYNLSALSRIYYYSQLNKKLKHFINTEITFGRVILKNKFSAKKYPHGHYPIVNMLDRRIPDYDSLDDIYNAMRDGVSNNNYNSDCVDDSYDEDDDDDSMIDIQINLEF